MVKNILELLPAVIPIILIQLIPPDLALSFGTICANSLYSAITYMRPRFEYMRERQELPHLPYHPFATPLQ